MNAESLTKPMNSEQVVKLVEPKEFDLAFFRLIEHMTHEQAYEYLEEQYSGLFKKRRYSSFESYRISRYKRQHDNN